MKKKIIIFVSLYWFYYLSAMPYTQPFFPYYSQVGQDKYVNENLFRDKKNGIFIDIGAHDGISFSNTYYFEKELGWTGICIEPHPTSFATLQHNRKALCYQLCAAKEEGVVHFLQGNGILEMYSGKLDAYDPRQLESINAAAAYYNSPYTIIQVPARTLSSILEENNIYEVDFLSLDTEGGERDILEGIDFNRFTIKCITIENNFPDKFAATKQLLIDNNYIHIAKLSQDEIFVLDGAFAGATVESMRLRYLKNKNRI